MKPAIRVLQSVAFLYSVVILGACDSPPDPVAPAPLAIEQAPAEPPASVASPAPARGEGHLHFTVRGGVFPDPVTFDLTSDALRAMSAGSSLDVVHVRREGDWVSEDGGALLTTLIFSISVPPEPGVYERPVYDFTFGLAADRTAPRAKTVRPEGETGTVTVTERTEDHVVGTFEVRGHATQMNSTEPVYTIEGDFAFAARR